MSHPTFRQSARHNLLVPVFIAFLVLGLAIALFIHLTPRKTADLTVVHTTILPTHTVFPSDSKLIGHEQAQDDLYVLTTLRVDDPLNLPLFLKDFTATLTTGEGQVFNTSAVEEHELANVYTAFPDLKPLSSAPLLRETMINPGHSAQGMVLLHFPVSKDVWDHRRIATLNVDLYHQGVQSIRITRASEALDNAPPPLPE